MKEIYYKSQRRIFTLFKYSLLLVFFTSLRAWFTWGFMPAIITSISLFIFIIFILENKEIDLNFKKYIKPVFALFCLEIYCASDLNNNAFIFAILTATLISVVLLLSDDLKKEIFSFLSSIVALIVFISLIEWVVFLIGVNLPHSTVDFNDRQYVFNNYYLFLKNLSQFEIIPRFSCVFLEPNYLGMILSFILFVNKYDIKKKSVIVMIIANLFTLSLAAYILMITSLFLIFGAKSKKAVTSILLLLISLYIIYIFAMSYNSGNNIINEFIFERLKFENGDIVGNDRFSESLDLYYSKFITQNDLYSGIGTINYMQENLGANAGYKVFIIQHGLIGAILIFILYYSIIVKDLSKATISFFVIYVISFLQGAYALWEFELILFITAIPFLKSTE